MHRRTYGGLTVHHNGDFSGDVHIIVPTYHPNKNYDPEAVQFVANATQRADMQRLLHGPDDLLPDYYEVKIPFRVMIDMVAEKLRRDLISELEQMEEFKILRLAQRRLLDECGRT